MTSISTNQLQRLSDLQVIFEAVTYQQNAYETVKKFEETTLIHTTPDDIVIFVHQLVEQKIPMAKLKSGISKLLNVLRRTLDNYPYKEPERESFFGVCIRNNEETISRLNKIRPYIKQINNGNTTTVQSKLINLLSDLQQIYDYYLIKENIIFPLVEKYLSDYRCIAVMWSIHDDIRRNINEVIKLLSEDKIDLKRFNRLIGDIFFDVHAIVFREERLLYPYIEKNIAKEAIEALWNESIQSGFPFVKPQQKSSSTEQINSMPESSINLKTGNLTAEQIILIFNHLPVDITYVDEQDQVRFFSTPKTRIFHRTHAIIGRDVHNCHPQESVHVVEEIIDSFRKGEKDIASFWITMRNEKKILIQYFAVRNEQNEYKGVVEVSQEINEIQKLEGERRILDWNS